MDNLRSKLNKDGFTLVELLVVIAIIAVLSVTAFISLGGETVKARDSKRMQDLSTIQNALEIHFINETSYPAADGTEIDPAIDKKYLSEIPRDPRDHDYYYVVSGSTYLIVATLEDDGDPLNYTAHVVGNGDEATLLSGDGVGGCDIVDGGNCIPYTP